ncbi:MAG: hypothetical protein ACXVBE_08630 [Bdellovibrionota bacterium]
MRKTSRSKEDQKWLEAVGRRLQKAILAQGYASPYVFWVEELGDEISRSTLHYILEGKVDAKGTTYKKIADSLKLPVHELFKGI